MSRHDWRNLAAFTMSFAACIACNPYVIHGAWVLPAGVSLWVLTATIMVCAMSQMERP